MLLVYPLTAQSIVGTGLFQPRRCCGVARREPRPHRKRRSASEVWLLVTSIPRVLLGPNMSIRVLDRARRVRRSCS